MEWSVEAAVSCDAAKVGRRCEAERLCGGKVWVVLCVEVGKTQRVAQASSVRFEAAGRVARAAENAGKEMQVVAAHSSI
jgi:hypothetical protein